MLIQDVVMIIQVFRMTQEDKHKINAQFKDNAQIRKLSHYLVQEIVCIVKIKVYILKNK